jgi:hypothetical protein
MVVRISILAVLVAAPLARSDEDRSRQGPDLELLVSTDAPVAAGRSTRSGLSGGRNDDTGVEPGFDASGAASYTGGKSASPAVPLLIDDLVDAPPPSPAAASPSSAPLAKERRAVIRFGVLQDSEGFDQVDFWQRLADYVGVRVAILAPSPRRAPSASHAAPPLTVALLPLARPHPRRLSCLTPLPRLPSPPPPSSASASPPPRSPSLSHALPRPAHPHRRRRCPRAHLRRSPRAASTSPLLRPMARASWV